MDRESLVAFIFACTACLIYVCIWSYLGLVWMF